MRLAPDGTEQEVIASVFSMDELEQSSPSPSQPAPTKTLPAVADDEPPTDRQRASEIAEQHKDKEFVRRILNPKGSPHLTPDDDDRLSEGQTASHQMGWGQNGPDGEATEFYVYPEIINEDGKMHWFKEGEPHGEYENAGDYASKTGERITFGSKDEAEWFSKNYKSLWDDE